MADITYKYESITANVKNYRGYDNFICSLHIKMSATDGTNTFLFERNYELDVEKEFTDADPFVPFDQWDSSKVTALADQLTTAAQTREYIARQLQVIAAQPKPKSFNF